MKRFLLVTAVVCVIVALVVMLKDVGKQHAFTFSHPAQFNSDLLQPVAGPASTFLADDWPQWRGVNRDGKSPSTKLLQDWPEEGPPLLWTAKGLGKGMSTVSVANGKLFTLGKIDGQVHLIARDAHNGEPVWSTPFDKEGEPTGAPTVHEDHVYAVSYNGKLVCADRASGKIVWTKDFVADFGGSVPTWGFCESPLIDGRMVVCTPGATDALVVALDRLTGETIWKCKTPEEMKGPGHAGAGYSSIVVSQGAGVRHYVQLVGQGVIGISPSDGNSLWGYTRVANGVASIPTPIVHGDYVFASTGYGAGATLLQLTKSDAGIEAREVYFHPGNKVQNHHGGMILVDDHVYLGHGQNNGLPVCIELSTGKIKWGPLRGPGAESAAIAFADGHLYFRYQNSVMALIEATPEAYKLKASFKLPSHLGNSWPHPVIAQGRLYLRDQDVLMCYDLLSH